MNPFLKYLPFGLLGLGLGYLIFQFTEKRPSYLPPTMVDKRSLVVNAAMSQVGSGDAQKYWDATAPGVTANKSLAWCGAFALWAIKQAGLAGSWFWQLGKGFLYQLPITHSPQPGDVAYFSKMQHHAVVQSVNPDGTVNLINGNGAGGKVSLSTSPQSAVAAFYSIQPLLV